MLPNLKRKILWVALAGLLLADRALHAQSSVTVSAGSGSGSGQTVMATSSFGTTPMTAVASTGTITTNGNAVVLTNGSNITFQAGSTVTLSPGFHAGTGSYFRAFIGTVSSYTLAVSGGSGGSAGIVAGTQVPISAGAPPSGQVFSSWTQSGPGSVTNSNAATTTFTMGAGGATVTANYVSTDTTPPSVPTGLVASSIGTTAFQLTWSASSDNIGVTGYEIRRDSSSIGTVTAVTAGINNGIAPATTYAMTVRAYDAAGNFSAWSSALSVTTSGGSGQPQSVVISPTSQTVTTGSSVSFSATGGQNGYVWANSGGSMTGSGSTRSVTFSGAGSFSVTVYSPSGGTYAQSNTASATITVNSSLQPPVITSATTATGSVGTVFSYQITATNSPTSYAATGLPSGLTLNSATGQISGTPAAPGSFSVGLSASNGAGTGTATLALTIASNGDDDGDGVSNAVEAALGTNPNAAATPDSTNQSQLKIHRPQP